MVWKNSAPSNIALIKYMGKETSHNNIPTNASLSYTLENLRTYVEIEKINSTQDTWSELKQEGCMPAQFSEKGQKRFLNFFAKLKNYYGVQENFHVRSANNFASDSGMASSASSFAALTITADQAFRDLGYQNQSGLKLYQISREGSGSSCRSFFSPWALWKNTEVFAPEIKIQKLVHKLVMINSQKKEVSSGDAHQRIETSWLNIGRKQRAEDRLQNLIMALNNNEWQNAFKICFDEFSDMHALFDTSVPSFRYMTNDSFKALSVIYNLWQELGDGPLVTMDAGPNIHLLYRENSEKIQQQFKKQLGNSSCI